MQVYENFTSNVCATGRDKILYILSVVKSTKSRTYRGEMRERKQHVLQRHVDRVITRIRRRLLIDLLCNGISQRG